MVVQDVCVWVCASPSVVLSVPKCVCSGYSQEKDDAGVGHGVWQTQNAAAHDGIAQVEDRHPKRGFTLELEKTEYWNINVMLGCILWRYPYHILWIVSKASHGNISKTSFDKHCIWRNLKKLGGPLWLYIPRLSLCSFPVMSLLSPNLFRHKVAQKIIDKLLSSAVGWYCIPQPGMET